MFEKIRERAYQLWQQLGEPEGQHDDHWLQAEREYNESAPGDGVEGEGSYAGARQYDEATTAFANSGKVGPAADAAVKSLDDPAEAAELKKAEEAGQRQDGSPMAHASSGDGCTGISTRSARAIIAAVWSDMVGAVPMKQNAPPCCLPMVGRELPSSANGTSARSGFSASRRSCHWLRVPC